MRGSSSISAYAKSDWAVPAGDTEIRKAIAQGISELPSLLLLLIWWDIPQDSRGESELFSPISRRA